MKGAWPIVVLGLAAPVLAADSGAPQDGLAWLKKMASASRQLNYSGTFVYRHLDRTETSRVVHYVNAAGGEFEKMETLDGPAREVIRTNDEVTCYLPAAKTVLIEKRGKRRFPSLLPEPLVGVSENYTVRLAGTDRVAGNECQTIVLTPKDALRYGHHFCADVASGLPLRARSFNEKNEPLESFAFTELKIGISFNRDKVRSRYAAKSRDWKIDSSAFSIAEAPADTGWVLTQRPAGFRKLTELKRSFAGRAAKVSHIVYSDGFAAVSVFIEPLPRARLAPNLWHQGAVNIFVRPVSDYMVTVLGEAPAATVMQISNSLEFRGGTPR
ncbi:MAG: MucB/RseB C-terminal domain-containing protein [Betaproteobacteria bacterium]|nr:MucB/RseB C-terminal domain-containing protein [Betaproteobacteria bacterium]